MKVRSLQRRGALYGVSNNSGLLCKSLDAVTRGSCEMWRWWVSEFLPSTCSKARTTIIITGTDHDQKLSHHSPGMTAEGD